MEKMRTRAAVVLAVTLSLLGLSAGSALAVDPTPGPAVTTVSGSILQGVTDALAVISTNMPLIFGVGLAFVAWKVGKRLLGKI